LGTLQFGGGVEGAELCRGLENRPFNIDDSGGEGKITTQWPLRGRLKIKGERLNR
jgi:hypothetical protein